MKGLLRPTQMEIAENAIDITEPMHGVEIQVDWKRKVLWVNVDGVCALRVCRAPQIEYSPPTDDTQ